ncbi:integrase [Kushneria konosiri]|uniref:Integrase n=2 Tax=Kushneria konosiri TaxID=698828 RepID=A0A2Z2HL88_9GAMM|nr:site-specific integrase [Kushneria konosiri]ARS54621.1 integrase [Kushneria konosiri]
MQEAALVERAPPDARSQLVEAGSDREVVAAWLMEYRTSPQTFRQYRKEAERLLLWLESKGKRLSHIDRRALDEFEAFLARPTPVTEWVGPPRPRQSDEWRPFRKGLSAASRRQALVILQTLFGWLIEAGWLHQNPFRLMRDKRRRLDNTSDSIERYLERPLWRWCWQQLNMGPPADATPRIHYELERRRFVFAFAYLLAPRVSEMSQARMNDFRMREGQWWWQVIGKGGKRASIPVPDAMMTALIQWRGMLGLPAMPSPEEETPVIRALDGRRGVGDNQLYRMIKATFERLAQTREHEGESTSHDAQRLRQATPHWLRHTAITHQAQQGVELRYLSRTARHSRLETTARYLHAETQEWHGQINRHTLDLSDEHQDDTL